jgi:hypothetical protein
VAGTPEGKRSYGGLEVAEVRRRQLEDENGRLKRLVAGLTLDNQGLEGLLGKTDACCAVERGAGGTLRREELRTTKVSRSYRWRMAAFAVTAISTDGSTGLTTWVWKPAARMRTRSSDRP